MTSTHAAEPLLAMIRGALAAERAQDRTFNRERALNRPAPVRFSTPQAGGTTILTLARPVHLARGAEVVLAGAGGPRAAVVRNADGGTSVEVEGLHADVQLILGRPLHLSERLENALEAALDSRAGVIGAAEDGKPRGSGTQRQAAAAWSGFSWGD